MTQDHTSKTKAENSQNPISGQEPDNSQQTDSHEEAASKRQRCTKEEYEQRCEEAADLLAEGYPGRVVVRKLAAKFKVTARQARTYVRDGERIAKEAVPVHDRAFLFAQTFAGLQADRIAARDSGNINAQVGASKQLVQMLKLISDIDPMRDFENAFMRAAASHLNNGKGTIPRESVTIGNVQAEGLF